ncbi:MAG: hypothetical protein ABFD54_14690 [Armatimonadota bacterium]|nr:hypothetical protein [bacterium]
MSNASGHKTEISPRIVNPIFFIRGVEPREQIDLLEPIVNAVELLNKHNLPATFLLQYDALQNGEFLKLINKLDIRPDIGIWLEIVQPLAEKAGLEWRGRWSWDYESHVDMLVGYAPDKRREMIDIFMEEFKSVLGYYPRSIGSWVLDAVTLDYLAEKYGVIAACNCKDQCGTDGYTLWGGYWNQAYYPSRSNALMPAQDKSHQIPIPIFRMLGSDPIYQYDHNRGESQQGVVSLEPVYPGGGGCDEWVDWFFGTNFKSPCLAFAYTQAGQENSFGWEKMKKGLIYQLGELERLRDEHLVRVETLADSGAWFKNQFDLTPATAVTALTDWKDENHKTVWYNSRFYRTNLFWEDDQFWIRDIHQFDQRYQERYLEDTCKVPLSIYDTLPVMDGYNWSTRDEIAGIRAVSLADSGCKPLSGTAPGVEEKSATDLAVSWLLTSGESLEVLCREDSLEISLNMDNWALAMSWSKDKHIDLTGITDKSLCYQHEGFTYKVNCSVGSIKQNGDQSVLILPENGRIIFNMNCMAQEQ